LEIGWESEIIIVQKPSRNPNCIMRGWYASAVTSGCAWPNRAFDSFVMNEL
jgi:hypothetical protein